MTEAEYDRAYKVAALRREVRAARAAAEYHRRLADAETKLATELLAIADELEAAEAK